MPLAAVVECYSCVPACVSLSLFATLWYSKHDTGKRSGTQARKIQLRFQGPSGKPSPAYEHHPHVSADRSEAKDPISESAELGTETESAIGAVVGAVIGTAVGTVVGAVVIHEPAPLAHVRAEGSLSKTVEKKVTPDDELYDGMVAPDVDDRKAIQTATEVCGVVRLAPLTQPTAPTLVPCESRRSEAAAAHPDVESSQFYANVGFALYSSEHLLRDTSSESLGDWELVDPSLASNIANANDRAESLSRSEDTHDKQSSELLKNCGVPPTRSAGTAQQRIDLVSTASLQRSRKSFLQQATRFGMPAWMRQVQRRTAYLQGQSLLKVSLRCRNTYNVYQTAMAAYSH